MYMYQRTSNCYECIWPDDHKELDGGENRVFKGIDFFHVHIFYVLSMKNICLAKNEENTFISNSLLLLYL